MVLGMKSFIRQIFKISDIFLKHKKRSPFELLLPLFQMS